MSGVISATAVALTAVGIGEATALIAAPILLGAATGAIGSAITGGNPLMGALTGGIGGGFGQLGGFVGDAFGIGSTAGGALAGGAGGALAAGISGGNPLMGALTGGVAGGISGYNASGPNSTVGDVASQAVGGAGGLMDSSGQNQGQGPTVANATDPGSLASLSAATNGSLDTSALNVPLTGALNAPAGASSANQNFLNGSPNTTVSSGAASPGFFERAGNYLFGNGTPTTPTLSASEALAKAQSTGQPQIYSQNGTMGTIDASGKTNTISSGSTKGGSTASGDSGNGLLGNMANSILSNPIQALSVGMGAYNQATNPAAALPTLAQQQASTQDPNFKTSLPQYNLTQTRNPIADYYTYGYSPQPTQISTHLTPTTGVGTGNAPTHLALGGMPRVRAPHIGVSRRSSGSGLQALGALSHMRRAGGAGGALSGGAAPSFAHGGFFSRNGQVQQGTGTKGQADKVPAMLSEDEYVIPADVVGHLGDGSSSAGGGVLDKFVANVRAHKAKKGMPPPAKTPAAYISGGA